MNQEERRSIMIVDDSPQDIFLLENELQDAYTINSVNSADDALAFLASHDEPDLILLDVNMPGINGYEACKIIKADPSYASIDIVFLSANDSTEEVIQGLKMGAIDYIVKPYDPEILQSKVKTIMETHDTKEQLKHTIHTTNELAHTMMSVSDRLGGIINFYRTSFTATSAQELTEETTKAIATQNLDCTVLASVCSNLEVQSSIETPTILELTLLERLVGHTEPFIEQGNRFFAIQENMVVMIRNMPQDEEKSNLLKDFVTLILEGANAKLKYLEAIAKQ